MIKGTRRKSQDPRCRDSYVVLSKPVKELPSSGTIECEILLNHQPKVQSISSNPQKYVLREVFSIQV